MKKGNPASAEAGRLLTKVEVARWLCVSVRTVRKLVVSGRLRQVCLSPVLVRFRPEDVAAAVEAMTAQGRTVGERLPGGHGK